MQIAIPSFDRLVMEDDLLRRLIRDAKSGDAASFERLVVLHERWVLRIAQRLLLNREAARDASQEVFLRLFRKIGVFDERQDFRAWLYRVTANICFDLLRRAKGELPVDIVPETASAHDTPERAAATHQQSELILAALQTLSPREREVIVLRDLEGYSSAEVASLLGSSETTVRSQISTGRVKLRRQLAQVLGKTR